jgi:hypothetical protein
VAVDGVLESGGFDGEVEVAGAVLAKRDFFRPGQTAQ